MGLVAPGMWDLPGPGLEPVSPALADGFLTTASLGKSQHLFSSSSGSVTWQNLGMGFQVDGARVVKEQSQY